MAKSRSKGADDDGPRKKPPAADGRKAKPSAKAASGKAPAPKSAAPRSPASKAPPPKAPAPKAPAPKATSPKEPTPKEPGARAAAKPAAKAAPRPAERPAGRGPARSASAAAGSAGAKAKGAAKAKTPPEATAGERAAPPRSEAHAVPAARPVRKVAKAGAKAADDDAVADRASAPPPPPPAVPSDARPSPTTPAPTTAPGPASLPPTPPPPQAASVPVPAPKAPTPKPIPAIAFADEEGWTEVEAEELEDDRPHPSRPAPSPALGGEEGWEPITDDDVAPAPRSPAHAAAPPHAAPGASSIPPLPDEDDVFEPIEADGPPREPPPGATPHMVLTAVRRGQLHVSALNAVPDEMLEALADDAGIALVAGERRAELVRRLLAYKPPEPVRPPVEVEGLLQVFPEGYGFLRREAYGWMAATSDPCVPPSIIADLGLATGHWLTAKARPPRDGEKYAEVTEVLEVNHEDPEEAGEVEPFDRLVVTHPDHRFLLETDPEQTSMRMMDLFCPLGRGQRALVVSPPRAGKTILLQAIADSLARNSPEVDIIVLLIDERPEEVTNMRRSVRGEVFASTFDQPAHRHIRLAELVLEKAKRMVEYGRHVVLLLDSLTRLGRAYNNESLETGRLLTGGLEASALTKPKAFFGAARNIEHGGSLTIVASALVDTGSRLDQVIFEEFKGTGNMEIALSRDLANRRLWPAIDIPKSGTRKEDLLLHPEELRRITILRRAMAGAEAPEVLTDLLQKMVKHKSNAELLMNVQG